MIAEKPLGTKSWALLRALHVLSIQQPISNPDRLNDLHMTKTPKRLIKFRVDQIFLFVVFFLTVLMTLCVVSSYAS